MKVYADKEIWFATGSQHLYGPETLAQVAEQSQGIARQLGEPLPIAQSDVDALYARYQNVYGQGDSAPVNP